MDTEETTEVRRTQFWEARLMRIFPRTALFALVLCLCILVRDEYLLRLLLTSLYFGTQAVAYDFTRGFIGVTNFGFAGFVGLGAYASALLVVKTGAPIGMGFVLGSVAASIVGCITGLLTLRLKEIYAACVTWFLSLALMATTTAMAGFTRGKQGLIVPYALHTAATRPYLMMLLLIAVLVFVLLSTVANSRTGLAFRAIGQNLGTARASGINPTKYRVLNFTISCGCAGLLGAFYAHFIGILTPEIMAPSHSMEVLALAHIGGIGSLWGGLVASVIVIPVFEYLKPLLALRLVIYGILLIVVTIFYPGGIAHLWQDTLLTLQRRWGSRLVLRGAGISADQSQ